MQSLKLQGSIFPVTQNFKEEWLKTPDFDKPIWWKSLVIPLVEEKPEEESIKDQLTMAMYMKEDGFVILKMGQSDPAALGRQVNINKRFKRNILVELPMDDVETKEDSESQWHKWHAFHSATNHNPKFKVCCR